MNPPRLALVRAAALSVADAARMVEAGDLEDPHVRLAIRAAAGRRLLDEASTSDRARDSALRYVARMGGRATPFGLFAGTAPARVAEDRHLVLAERDAHRVRTRVDLAALERCVRAAADAAPALASPLRVNPLARQEGRVVRFAKAGDATADVVTIELTAFVAEVLTVLGSGSCTGEQVRDALLSRRPGLAAGEVADALARLVEAGLLERDLGLLEPGVEPAARAEELLGRLGDEPRRAAVASLRERVGGLRPVDAAAPEAWDAAWADAARGVEEWGSVAEPHRFDHQLELQLPNARLDERTVADLERAVGHLRAIVGQGSDAGGDGEAWSPEVHLGRFKQAFRARYEDAEVPILAAVDLESGVLQSPRRQVSTLAVQAGISVVDDPGAHASVPRRVMDIYRRASWEPTVDISDLPCEEPGCRAVFALLLDGYEGRYGSMLVGSMGRSPFALMARFGLGRPELADAFAAQLAAERELEPAEGEDPDPIRAELVYNPGGRIANVLVRPRLLDDTVALTGASGGTLSLDQLTLRLRGDRFVLRDLASGRPVVLELNSAHNVDFLGLDPVYALLGRLAGDGGVGWSWGALDAVDHLPRVTCGSVIVAPEQWRLDADAVAALRASEAPAADLRRKLGLTEDHRRWLGSGVLDHILPIDTSSDRSVRLALARLAPGEGVKLVEMPQAEAPAATGPDGGHVTEAVISVGRALRPAARPPASDIVHCPRAAEGWVYARLGCGLSSADRVIEEAAALAERLLGQGVVDRWFFLRYAEGGHHVRVRVHAVGAEETDRALIALAGLGTQLRAAGLVTSMAFDSYVPEITRYGGRDTLALAERVFTASSAEAARFVAGRPAEAARLYRAVGDAVAWAQALFDDPADAIAFLQGCAQGLQVRFARSGNRHGKLLRDHRAELADALDAADPDEATLTAVRALAGAVRRPGSGLELLPIVGSCLHMHCNRIFAFDAVRLEYLCYEFAIRRIRELSSRKR